MSNNGMMAATCPWSQFPSCFMNVFFQKVLRWFSPNSKIDQDEACRPGWGCRSWTCWPLLSSFKNCIVLFVHRASSFNCFGRFLTTKGETKKVSNFSFLSWVVISSDCNLSETRLIKKLSCKGRWMLSNFHKSLGKQRNGGRIVDLRKLNLFNCVINLLATWMWMHHQKYNQKSNFYCSTKPISTSFIVLADTPKKCYGIIWHVCWHA